MFEKLVWRKDRMLLDDLVFRLEHYKSKDWELGDDCFMFYKIKPLVDQYAKFWSLRRDFRPQNIFELGIWDGGSIAFWFECFQPEKHVGIDILKKQDSLYFWRYISSRGLEERIKTYWTTDQADSERLWQIVKNEFSGPLDLVIDDASHMYEPTKTSFETLFPLLRPGGLYVIEDWAWSHWKEFQAPDHPWATETPLTKLIFELVEVIGTGRSSSSSRPLIANLTVFQGFAVVERGEFELLAEPIEFKLEDFISRRPETRAANLEQLVASKEAHIRNLEQLVVSKEAYISNLEQRLTTIESTRAWQLTLKFYAFCHFVSRAVEPIKRMMGKPGGKVNQSPEVDPDPNMSRLGEGQMVLEEYKLLCQNAAQRWGVSSEVHPEDFVFRFVVEVPAFESKEKAVEYYFNDGANSARELHKILVDICGFGDDRLNLLEFASGYGCVTRHIRNVMPFCRITACDIHQQAVQFIQEKLGIEAVLSASRPEDLDLNRLFDVVFALSFFSHMPKKTFARWLKELSSFVRPEGYFIFTTHGLSSRRFFKNCQFDKDGFYFYPTSEQKDLSTKEYGSTVVTPQYVFNRIFEIPNLALKYFYEGYWWNHQDLYIVKVVGDL